MSMSDQNRNRNTTDRNQDQDTTDQDTTVTTDQDMDMELFFEPSGDSLMSEALQFQPLFIQEEESHEESHQHHRKGYEREKAQEDLEDEDFEDCVEDLQSALGFTQRCRAAMEEEFSGLMAQMMAEIEEYDHLLSSATGAQQGAYDRLQAGQQGDAGMPDFQTMLLGGAYGMAGLGHRGGGGGGGIEGHTGLGGGGQGGGGGGGGIAGLGHRGVGGVEAQRGMDGGGGGGGGGGAGGGGALSAGRSTTGGASLLDGKTEEAHGTVGHLGMSGGGVGGRGGEGGGGVGGEGGGGVAVGHERNIVGGALFGSGGENTTTRGGALLGERRSVESSALEGERSTSEGAASLDAERSREAGGALTEDISTAGGGSSASRQGETPNTEGGSVTTTHNASPRGRGGPAFQEGENISEGGAGVTAQRSSRSSRSRGAMEEEVQTEMSLEDTLEMMSAEDTLLHLLRGEGGGDLLPKFSTGDPHHTLLNHTLTAHREETWRRSRGEEAALSGYKEEVGEGELLSSAPPGGMAGEEVEVAMVSAPEEAPGEVEQDLGALGELFEGCIEEVGRLERRRDQLVAELLELERPLAAGVQALREELTEAQAQLQSCGLQKEDLKESMRVLKRQLFAVAKACAQSQMELSSRKHQVNQMTSRQEELATQVQSLTEEEAELRAAHQARLLSLQEEQQETQSTAAATSSHLLYGRQASCQLQQYLQGALSALEEWYEPRLVALLKRREGGQEALKKAREQALELKGQLGPLRDEHQRLQLQRAQLEERYRLMEDQRHDTIQLYKETVDHLEESSREMKMELQLQRRKTKEMETLKEKLMTQLRTYRESAKEEHGEKETLSLGAHGEREALSLGGHGEKETLSLGGPDVNHMVEVQT